MGVHSRIVSKARRIFEAANVGNFYFNRDIVGAVVGVQPFGGQGLSGTVQRLEDRVTFIILLLKKIILTMLWLLVVI